MISCAKVEAPHIKLHSVHMASSSRCIVQEESGNKAGGLDRVQWAGHQSDFGLERASRLTGYRECAERDARVPSTCSQRKRPPGTELVSTAADADRRHSRCVPRIATLSLQQHDACSERTHVMFFPSTMDSSSADGADKTDFNLEDGHSDVKGQKKYK
ncbi:hypothetical protein F2P81_012404 [Scophthalmus maximus]|uniref:Uncharacterized protein n=1 Tax=Scophthalmus maximus TaxID=52904 RepID=A0A6A4SHK1_SCOMX|nr:hypothetical protein F2P81_012404 [Scophthalmus maximus]